MEGYEQLKERFHEEMLDLYYCAAKEIHHYATDFVNMVNKDGGLETAKRLLGSKEFSSGLTRLWQEGRLDLSMEAKVLIPEYTSLFTDEEKQKAQKNSSRTSI